MARVARLVVPDHPHHVIQRGNRRMQVFFGDDDYRAYIELVAAGCRETGTDVWAYALMPDHVHLILVPRHADGLRAALGDAHRRYTRRINAREDWRGHLWQERFLSYPMQEAHCLSCARYVELNPVAAGLAKRPEDWPWSSARAHLAGSDDELASAAPLLEMVPDWKSLLAAGVADLERKRVERHLNTGRPLGDPAWIEDLETSTGRRLTPGRPGRPRKASA